MDFVYVKVPLAERRGRVRAAARPDGRHDALHQHLESALQAAGAGSLVGWGPSLEAASGHLGARPAFHRIDIELGALDTHLPLLRAALDEAPVPPGTELHYQRARHPVVEVRGPQGWRPAA